MILIKLFCHINAIIKKFFYSMVYGRKITFGHETTFRKGFTLMIGDAGNVRIGRHCFFNNGCSINCLQSVSIGDGSIFGENVKIYDHNHRFSDFSKSIKQQGYSVETVTIGERCWIGSNVTILKGANIGKNCVIGAGCVISGEVQEGTLVKPKDCLIREQIRGI